MKKIIMTGSHGRVGTALMAGLKDKYKIYEINRSGEESETYFLADVADFDKLKEVFAKIGPVDGLVHLAGDPRMEADWQSILKSNIEGTRNVFEAARLSGIKKIVFASTNHVMGGYEGIPSGLYKEETTKLIKTSDPIRPDSDYGVSKAFGEAMARMYYEVYGMSFICLRFGSISAENRPLDERQKKTWLSHRDLAQLVDKGLESKVGFGIYFGVSNNKGRFWDIENAKKDLGYQPKDNGSGYL